MNHYDWINLFLQVLPVVLSYFGAHYGAKNGVSSANNEKK